MSFCLKSVRKSNCVFGDGSQLAPLEAFSNRPESRLAVLFVSHGARSTSSSRLATRDSDSANS